MQPLAYARYHCKLRYPVRFQLQITKLVDNLLLMQYATSFLSCNRSFEVNTAVS